VMIKNGTIEPTEQEIKDYGLDQQQAPDPQQEAITTNIAMQTEKLMAEIEEKDAKTIETKAKSHGALVDAYNQLIETYTKQLALGIPLTEYDRQMVIKQKDIIAESQQLIDEGANSEQTASIIQDAVATEENAERENLKQVLTVQQPSVS